MQSLSRFIWVILLILSLSSGGCKDKEAIEEAPKPIEVEVIRVASSDMIEHFEVGGILQAEQEAMVSAEINGTVDQQFFREGDLVKVGEILLTFDKEPFVLHLELAKANLRKAEVILENSRKEYERRIRLKQDRFLSEETAEQALRLFRLATADLDIAKSNLNLAQRDFNKTELHASISGIIIKRHREIGEQVLPGTPLFKIADTRSLRIVAGLSEEQILHVLENAPVGIHLKPFGGQVFTGTVKRVGIPATNQGGTFPVEVVMDNRDQLLKPGMVGKVVFSGQVHKGVFLVPRDTVVERMGEEVVYLVRDNSAVSRKVVRGIDFGFYISIRTGLSDGDMVAVIGQERLYDGAPVHVRKIREEIHR